MLKSIERATLKLFAIVLIVLPIVPPFLKKWAYAGIVLFYITAINAHIVHSDPRAIMLINVALTANSYYYQTIKSAF